MNVKEIFGLEKITQDMTDDEKDDYYKRRFSNDWPTIFKIKCDLRILLETGMILLIVCGVVLVVSIVGARMYILFKEKNIKKHRFDY